MRIFGFRTSKTFGGWLDHLCRKWEVRPVGRWDTKAGAIYYAEARQSSRPTGDGLDYGPGWTVLVAVDGASKAALPVYMTATASPEQRKSCAWANGLQMLGRKDAA